MVKILPWLIELKAKDYWRFQLIEDLLKSRFTHCARAMARSLSPVLSLMVNEPITNSEQIMHFFLICSLSKWKSIKAAALLVERNRSWSSIWCSCIHRHLAVVKPGMASLPMPGQMVRTDCKWYNTLMSNIDNAAQDIHQPFQPFMKHLIKMYQWVQMLSSNQIGKLVRGDVKLTVDWWAGCFSIAKGALARMLIAVCYYLIHLWRWSGEIIGACLSNLVLSWLAGTWSRWFSGYRR